MVEYSRYEIAGSYGDKKVIVEHARSKVQSGWLAVLFHGVHGCSSFEGNNKYGSLGSMLLNNGVDVCLVETSRARRDRESFCEDRVSWAKASFCGKTYAQDLYDECSALSFIMDRFSFSRLCLWGFSLGGIHSLFITGSESKEILTANGLEEPSFDPAKVNLLVLSGVGDSIRDEAGDSLSLPILDSISESGSIQKAASRVKVPEVVFFYGGDDGTFSELASRNLFKLMPVSNKVFHIIRGSDHAFRNICGEPSVRPLEIMVSTLTKDYFMF